MTTMNNNKGYIPDEPSVDDYQFLGSSGIASYGAPLVPNGQWDAYLPDSELQYKNGTETQSCVTFSILNCLEALFKKKYGGDYNFAERYIASLSGTTQQGNSPRTVCDTIRSDGLIPDALLPFDTSIRSFEEFMSPKPMEAKYLIEGARWLSKWVFQYEKVNPTTIDMVHALTYSPLMVSVRAWEQRDGLYVSDPDEQHNHATVVYGFEVGKYWKCFDSYDNTHKRLAWSYPFKQVLRFHIEPNTKPKNWFVDILKNFLNLLRL